MQLPFPATRDLVLVGGGHSHALILRMWGMSPLPGVRVTVINPGPVAAYSGMLPGHVAGHYSQDALEIDLVKLARFAGARLVRDVAVAMDPEARRVRLASGRDIGFDVASIDIGIHSEMPDIPGFRAHAVGAKPLDQFAKTWRDHLERIKLGAANGKVAVIGGGVAGFELALTMGEAIRGTGVIPEIVVIDRSAPLDGVGPRARGVLMAASLAYLVYLAGRIALAGSKLAFIDARRRPGVKDGILLQIINPKAYAVNSALYSGFAFLPDNLLLETLLKLLIGNAVWFPIHLIWLFAGSALHRLDLAETTQKRINYAMAAAMMTVVLLGVSAAL